jgi:hypothetical protein
MTTSIRDVFKRTPMIYVDYSALELRLMRHYHLDFSSIYGMKKLPYDPGDYIRTKTGPRDLRVCTSGKRWRATDPDHSRLQIRVRRPGSRKSHWSWADRWVRASPLEALAAQAEDIHEKC